MTSQASSSQSLIELSGLSPSIKQQSIGVTEEAWIEVVQSMDKVYADLVHSQVKFEEKNDELVKAYKELRSAHEKLKNTQQQLIQSEKMASLGRLVAGVAHELNNPISFVYSNMFALQHYYANFSQYIDAIHNDINKDERNELRAKLRIDNMMNDIIPLIEGSMEGANRVSDIVKNLRKYSTPQKQKHQKHNLIAVIKRAIEWVLKATSLKINIIESMPSSLFINNNEGYIHQILINLLQNAVDAMGNQKTPKLAISVTQKNNKVLISIIDNGQGVDATEANKLFDPFYTTKPVGNGTGLGLSISIGLAKEQCQGNLCLGKANKNGAEFILSLPLDEATQNV